MKKRYTEAQIPYVLRLAEQGTPAAEVCSKLGVSEPTFLRLEEEVCGNGGNGVATGQAAGGRVVSVAHANPFMTDYAERQKAGRAFFAGEMSVNDADQMIIRYNISHLLLKQSQLGLERSALPIGPKLA